MRQNRTALCGLGSIVALCLIVSPAAAQQTRSTEVKRFEVVSVDGNKVVVKGDQGAQEITVPDDFRLTVEGQRVSVHDLKPGMKGTATITTTTTVTPVSVTEVRNGEVFRKSGNSIICAARRAFRCSPKATWKSAASPSSRTADRSPSPTFTRVTSCPPRSSRKVLRRW